MVGLGNPGEQYEATRHNVGESVVRLWAADSSVTLSKQKSWGYAAKIPGSPVILAVTAGYMNVSGGPVAALAKYYRVAPEQIVVLHDELDLPLGTIRLKRGGGHGGHNGLRDIHKALGTPEFHRIRLGIGRPPGRMDPAAFVLKPFATAEQPEVDLMRHRAIDAVTALVERGLEPAQQLFHAPDSSS